MEKRILEIIVCPLCKGKLHYDRDAKELICRFDKLAYPVCDGVPIMMVVAARDLQSGKNSNSPGSDLNAMKTYKMRQF